MKALKILIGFCSCIIIISCSTVPAPRSSEMGILMFKVNFPEIAIGESNGRDLNYTVFVEFINKQTNSTYSYLCKNKEKDLENIKIIYNIPEGRYLVKKIELIANLREKQLVYIPIIINDATNDEATIDINNLRVKYKPEIRFKQTREKIILYYDSVKSDRLPEFEIIKNKILMLGSLDLKVINANSDLLKLNTMIKYIKKSNEQIFYRLTDDFSVKLNNSIEEYGALTQELIKQKKIAEVWKGVELVFYSHE